MAFEIKLSKVALKELQVSVDWYNDRQDGLGARFIAAVDERLELLTETPDIFPVKQSGFNEVIVADFPYLIVYKILKGKNRVRILHIFHTKRKPEDKDY